MSSTPISGDRGHDPSALREAGGAHATLPNRLAGALSGAAAEGGAEELSGEIGGGKHRLEWTDAARIAVVAICAAAVSFRVWEPLGIRPIGVIGLGIGGGPILKEAAENLRARRMTCIGRDTSYGRIIEAMERAERSRAPVQRLADQLAGYLVYFALGAAALTFALRATHVRPSPS